MVFLLNFSEDLPEDVTPTDDDLASMYSFNGMASSSANKRRPPPPPSLPQLHQPDNEVIPETPSPACKMKATQQRVVDKVLLKAKQSPVKGVSGWRPKRNMFAVRGRPVEGDRKVKMKDKISSR